MGDQGSTEQQAKAGSQRQAGRDQGVGKTATAFLAMHRQYLRIAGICDGRADPQDDAHQQQCEQGVHHAGNGGCT